MVKDVSLISNKCQKPTRAVAQTVTRNQITSMPRLLLFIFASSVLTGLKCVQLGVSIGQSPRGTLSTRNVMPHLSLIK